MLMDRPLALVLEPQEALAFAFSSDWTAEKELWNDPEGTEDRA